ncbi:MAG TPA: PD-(D/E)XK nuclease family protein [Terracidiphilus sp.]|nr:PD-(D/E)XK nuclease family protein [Terracidiphilus sp.]
MGTVSGSELDAWLSAGALVVASSDRAARAVLAAYHRARRREGRNAWTTPRVLPWHAFVRQMWEDRAGDARLLLSPQQELSLWNRILQASGQPAAAMAGPRRKVAELAMQAHALVCSFAPKYLQQSARAAWDRDAEAWSGWLAEFDAACRDRAAVSADRIALELPDLLEVREQREPLLLAGFDRLTPAQRRVLDAWGAWRLVAHEEPAENVAFYRALDARSELAACAAWCRQVLAAGPERRVLVIAQDVAQRRGEMERAFLRQNERDAELLFEFSLGVPLASVPMARSAEMLLRWLGGALEEPQLDWLIASGRSAAGERETAELAAAMRTVRRRKHQRTHWELPTFVAQIAPLARPWADRMTAAQRRLAAASGHHRSPIEWAEIASHLLEAMGWPGSRQQSSAEFQAARRWSQVVDACGSLGFDGRRVPWSEFLDELRAALADTLFAPESEDAPIVIAGPAESAGLNADAAWFLGADENAWPACGDMHPLLPPAVQREARMPHASAALDWEVARAITERLLRSAPQIRFSYAAQTDGSDARPSRLAMQMAGAPQPVPHELTAARTPQPLAVACEDVSRIPLPMDGATENAEDGAAMPAEVRGGATVITAQSQCPFKAFARARLQAESWDPAEMSLTAAERGELVHAALHAVWAGPPRGLRSLEELRAVPDLGTFVAGHVRDAMQNVPRRVRDRMPAEYLALEERRLARLIAAWLEYERTRVEFHVAETEVNKPVSVAGLPLRLRLDRLDRLNDGSFLVIDYKTGVVSDRAWELPRPEDLQLPLYAGYGLDAEQAVGGLAFARVRAGKEMGFAGRIGDALGTLKPSLGARSPLVTRPFQADQLMDWRKEIEKLARDFIEGRADVDPRDRRKTCERCDLHALCRIQERDPGFDDGELGQDDADA